LKGREGSNSSRSRSFVRIPTHTVGGPQPAMSLHSDEPYRLLMTGHPQDGWKMGRLTPYRKSTEHLLVPALCSPGEPAFTLDCTGRAPQLWSSLAPGIGRYVRAMDASSRFCQCSLARSLGAENREARPGAVRSAEELHPRWVANQSWLMFGFPVQLFIGIGVVNEQRTNRAEEL
jgi:hypothetical protein